VLGGIDAPLGLAVALFVALLAAILRAALGACSRSWLYDYTPDAKERERLERWLAREDRLDVTLSLLQVTAEAWFVLSLPGLIPQQFHGLELGPPGSMRHLAACVFVGITALVPLVHALPNTIVAGGRAEGILKPALGTLNVLSLLLFPLVEPLVLVRGRASALLSRGQRPEQRRELLTRDIVDAVAESERAGALRGQSAEMIERILALEDRVISEVMTPRTDLTSVSIDATLGQAAEIALIEGHSKIPVFEKNRDQIRGLFHLRDALPHLGAGVHPFTTVGEVMREAMFVPETKKVAPLLRELQAAKQSVAIVLDEYGGTAGIITVEDILEEIVGEITESHDVAPQPPLARSAEGTLSIDPRLRIVELNEQLEQIAPFAQVGAVLPESSDYDTVGGFVLKHLDRIPLAGESFEFGALEFRVLSIEGRRLARLQVRSTIVAPS
jgi:magnesium and cobalt transporter